METQSGYDTLTHIGTELDTIVQENQGKFAREMVSEIRDIMLDETAQLSIIRIAETIKEVLLVPEGYARVGIRHNKLKIFFEN